MRISLIRRCAQKALPGKIPTNHPIDTLPPAAEAPHLLEASVQSKPFISPKRLKAFTASLLIGASCVGSVYVLLSKNLSDRHLEEQELVERIAAVVKKENSLQDAALPEAIAKASRQNILGDFVAPSSFHELRRKMEETADQQKAHFHSTLQKERPLLHQEAIYRLKTTWNDMITNVQVSLETYAIEYKLRRDRKASENVKSRLLQVGGVDLDTLKRVA